MKSHALFAAIAVVAVSLFSTPAHALGRMKQNLHLIEEDRNGFAIYRVSQPNADDMKTFCKLGITEIMVLSGDGQIDADLAKANCPQLKVIYNTAQSVKVPLSGEFLDAFDSWVKDSQAKGKRIAFRCHCGCHRTGRLAAYFQMKFRGMSSKNAIAEMKDLGKYMILYPMLDNQVRALEDYIQGRPCSEKEKHCVRKTEASFAEISRALASEVDER